MKEKENILEPIWEKAEEYGKTNLELIRLKVIDKTSDLVSTILPNFLVFVSALVFVLFLNLGIAFWLGEIWNSAYLGFFAVAAFYGVCGLIIHFLMHDKLKERIRNAVIKQLLK